MVESGGDPIAWNPRERAVGIVQIRQLAVNDINHHYGTRYKLGDFYDVDLSRWAVGAYARIHKARTPEQIARTWNGGPQWRKKKATVVYWQKVRSELPPEAIRNGRKRG